MDRNGLLKGHKSQDSVSSLDVMIDFRYQLDGARGCPGSWLNIIFGYVSECFWNRLAFESVT